MPCPLQLSHGQIERGGCQKGRLEVDTQPSTLRTDACREHTPYVLGAKPGWTEDLVNLLKLNLLNRKCNP